MSTRNLTSQQRRLTRHARVRATVIGTPAKPRLNVHRSLTGMFLQIIDDAAGKTLVSVHSKTTDTKGDTGEYKAKEAVAYLLGKALAEKAKALNITTIVFDRGGYGYHGRVKAAAEGARAGGLVF